MKPLVIYHKSCADGFGAAYAAWRHFGDQAEYLPMKYGDKLEAAQYWNRKVYVLDFSFPKSLTEHIISQAESFVWLDHHKTAFEDWCGKDYLTPERQVYRKDSDYTYFILLDNTRSGAMIAWEFFHTQVPTPQLIKHIDDYDRWQFKIPGTKALNKAIWAEQPWTFEKWGKWASEPLEGMMQVGSYLLQDHEQRVRASVLGGSMPVRLGDFTGLAVNCPPNMSSDVGHMLAVTSGTFGLCWTLDKDKIVQCSLRSNGEFDVSVIAKHFGGGGHKNAAGFQLSDLNKLMGLLV